LFIVPQDCAVPVGGAIAAKGHIAAQPFLIAAYDTVALIPGMFGVKLSAEHTRRSGHRE
jgi:hypothetical protein